MIPDNHIQFLIGAHTVKSNVISTVPVSTLRFIRETFKRDTSVPAHAFPNLNISSSNRLSNIVPGGIFDCSRDVVALFSPNTSNLSTKYFRPSPTRNVRSTTRSLRLKENVGVIV